MILVISMDGILSCSPSLVNMSVKFWGVSAMRPPSGSGGKLQPLLQRMQGQSGQAADHGTVEANILQVAPHRELDATDQHVDVPRLHLIGDEAADTALLALHEIGEDAHHAAVDLRPDGGVAGKLAADLDQHGLELAPHLAVGGL